MLYRSMVTETILEVKEVQMSGLKTEIKYFYTDIENWIDMSLPDASKRTNFNNVEWYNRKKDISSINYCKKYHLTALGLY